MAQIGKFIVHVELGEDAEKLIELTRIVAELVDMIPEWQQFEAECLVAAYLAKVTELLK